MSDSTTNLLLPYLMAAQAQKHVTHNEAIRMLESGVASAERAFELQMLEHRVRMLDSGQSMVLDRLASGEHL